MNILVGSFRQKHHRLTGGVIYMVIAGRKEVMRFNNTSITVTIFICIAVCADID